MQRQFRLRRSADFDNLRAHGKTWRHPFLTMAVTPNGLAYNRYGYITSHRLGGAVVRNRVRRVLREIVRLSGSSLKNGNDILFIARNEIVEQPYGKVKDSLEGLFKRADLWQSSGAAQKEE